MKKMWGKGIMILMASAVISLSAITSGFGQGSVSLQVFYDELAPYGTWMQHNQYGNVWLPSVDQGFVPYGTNGYWVNTAYGNTWVSDYSWGWAPFHYGRWFYDDFYGWMWVPDTTWAPAWVTWRSGGGYYGWAPLMPGWGINVSVSYYNHIPYHYWNFVPYRYVMYRSVYRHCVPRPQVVNVIHHTTIINNYNRGGSNGRDRATYFTGPERHDIERRNHERVPVYQVSEQGRPGRTQVNRTSVSIYRPQIDGSPRSRTSPSNMIEERRGNDALDSRRSIDNINDRQDGAGNMRSNNSRSQRTVPQNDERFRSMETDRNNFRREQNDGMERIQRSRPDDQHLEQRQRDQSQNFERMQRSQPQEQRFQREPARSYERPGNTERQQSKPEQHQFTQPRREQPAMQQERRSISPDHNRSSAPQVQRQQTQRSQPSRSNGSNGGSSTKRRFQQDH